MRWISFFLGTLMASACFSQQLLPKIDVEMYLTTSHQDIGDIEFTQTPTGLSIYPNLHHLPEGLHGFHLHYNPNCSNHGQNSGNYYYPHESNGPSMDLPVIFINDRGDASLSRFAPGMTIGQIRNHSLVINTNDDNFEGPYHANVDSGALLACGTIAP